MKPLCVLLVLVLSGASSAIHPPSLNKALKLRGGGAVEIPAAKQIGFLGAAMGTVDNFMSATSPKRTLEAYGIGNPSPRTQFLCERFGYIGIMLAVTVWTIVLDAADINEAVAFGTLPGVYSQIKKVLNEEDKNVGFGSAGSCILLVMYLYITYTMFTEAGYPNTVLKAYAIFSLVEGLVLAVAPMKAAKVWGMSSDLTALESYMMKFVGVNTLALAALLGSLALGITEWNKLIGIVYIPPLIHFFIVAFITGELDKLGLPKGQFYSLLVLMALIVAVCSVQ